MGTRTLLELATQMPQLISFVHVSTYFVNNHLPRNTIVKEELYRLELYSPSGSRVNHKEYVDCMMGLPREAAHSHTLKIMEKVNFTSTYAFGKNLTEQLVADTPLGSSVRKAIVRPGLIAGLMGDPYPGYYGNMAGFTALALGELLLWPSDVPPSIRLFVPHIIRLIVPPCIRLIVPHCVIRTALHLVIVPPCIKLLTPSPSGLL
jgi:nucleoside-diphosphate-sugar epimerase